MHFYDIVDLLLPSDVLVINDSKVIPARLYGLKEGIPGADVELLLLKNHGLEVWETLVKPGKRARVGDRIIFSEGRLSCLVESITKKVNRLVKFDYDRTKYQRIYEILHKIAYASAAVYYRKAGIPRAIRPYTPKSRARRRLPQRDFISRKNCLKKSAQKGLR